ncbi:MAG: hypothetical protein KGI50_06835 [Patescibacteria group bacterium]|nr:hypothetical protein [Patescibacteria group bacterium]MDE2439289.1 hypothetical protein [Patescibacteria group bacterium]
MRIREYISPSAIKKFYDNVEDYYLHYLADTALEKEPQTQPMSIGSAFDAYTKSYLHERLFGVGNDPRFSFEAIFETQVEACNRDWARIHGKRAFDDYKRSGALNDLYLDLSAAQGTPRFEFEIKDTLQGDVSGVVFVGKPDCYYKNKDGHPIVLDWKVNGWCGKGNTSPYPGYVRIRHGDGTVPKQLHHKDAKLITWNGVTINKAKTLEQVNEDWAGQLSVYGWLLGEPVGGEFVTCIHQLACKGTGGFPEVRIAEHCTYVSAEFQKDYYNKSVEMWNVIHSDHILRHLSKEESQSRCSILDTLTVAEAQMEDTEENRLFKQLNKTRTW